MDTNFMTVEIERKRNVIERYRERIVEEQEKDKPDTRLITSYIRSIDGVLEDLDLYQKIKNHLDEHF